MDDSRSEVVWMICHTQLKGGERGNGRKVGGGGQELGGELVQDFSNGNGVMTLHEATRVAPQRTAE